MDKAWPDLESLDLLVAVADYGGIGAAARAVGMAQPNASRALAALEAKLGVALLIRHPRGAQITDRGETVVEQARHVIDATEALMAEVAAVNAELRTHLEIAASLTVAEHLLPAWLATARREHPGLEVRVRVCNSEEVFDEVISGRSALGFVETPQIRRGLHSRAVALDRLVTVVGPKHPWAGAGTISPGTLASTPLIVREEGSGTRSTLDEVLRRWDPVAPAVELGSNAAVVAAARLGDEPAVLSELAVASEVLRGELVVVPVASLALDRELKAVWRGRKPAPAASSLLSAALG